MHEKYILVYHKKGKNIIFKGGWVDMVFGPMYRPLFLKEIPIFDLYPDPQY
jgi:hypothetical protein